MGPRAQVINTWFFRDWNKCLKTCRSFRTMALSKLLSAAVIWLSMSVFGLSGPGFEQPLSWVKLYNYLITLH